MVTFNSLCLFIASEKFEKRYPDDIFVEWPMHELGLMQNIVTTVQEYAHANNIQKVAKVILTVGKISGVVPEALEFCFAVCVKDTVLEGAQLEIERVPARGKCRSCAEEFELLEAHFSCPRCGGSDWEMISGRELVIKGLEVV